MPNSRESAAAGWRNPKIREKRELALKKDVDKRMKKRLKELTKKDNKK